MAVSQLTMKLVMDTNSRRVIFAEVDNECVDFLFHILSLPIGNVIRLLTTKEMVGSLGNLYDSLENLDSKYIQPNQDKDALLKPKTAACNISSVPMFLIANSPELERQFYTCHYHKYYVTDDPRTTCSSTSQPINTNVTKLIQGYRVSTDGPPTPCPLSSGSIKPRVTRSKKVKKVVKRSKKRTEDYPSCRETMNIIDVEYSMPLEENEVVTYISICGRSMNTKLEYVTPPGFNRGFAKGVVTYMVSDDLVVKPMSVISSIILMKEFSIKDIGGLKEKVVTLGMNEALKLLKSSLQSKSVLTSVFMDDINMIE